MQYFAHARTCAEEIQNKTQLYENHLQWIAGAYKKGFCVETAEQSVLSWISCQIRNSDSFHEKTYYCLATMQMTFTWKTIYWSR